MRTNYRTDKKRLGLVRKHSWSSKRWDAEYKLRDMYDLLWALGHIFDEIKPWIIINRGCRRLGKNLKNALFTFETRLEEAGGVSTGTPSQPRSAVCSSPTASAPSLPSVPAS